jgi:hypothetical protein
MLLQRSKLAAATVERPRLAPPWSIVLLGMLVLTVLVGIFPQRALVNRVLEAPQDEITEAYLVNLIRTDPENPRLSLLLARHQLSAGLLDRVAETLAPLADSTAADVRLEALWLGWRVEEQRYLRLPDDAPERGELRHQLRTRLKVLASYDWPEDMLIEIARRAIVFGDTSLGLRLLERLAVSNQGRSSFWYAEAARTALAGGEYRAAGQFFLIAAQRSANPVEQRRFFIDGMLALQSGDLVREALAEAEESLKRMPQLGESTQVLELLVRFARAIQRPDLADKYARKLLRLSLQQQWQREMLARQWNVHWQPVNEGASPRLPFDDRIYTLGFEAFLDNRKLEDAWQVAAAAVRQAPDDLAWRERLARVSEWTGRPAVALTHWLHVAKVSGRDEAWQAVLRLAPGLFDDEALRPALEYRLQRQPGNAALVDELVATYERLGDPASAIRFLDGMYLRYRRSDLLARMAEIAERMGDDSRALLLWQRYMADAEPNAAQAMHIAVLQLTAGRVADALATLEGVDETSEAGTAYWRLRGDLAARLGADDRAIAAYRNAIHGEEAEASEHVAPARLLLDEHPLEAARVSGEAWNRFRDTRLLMQALELYSAAARWPEAGRLLRSLSPDEAETLGENAAFLRYSAQYHLAVGLRGRGLADLDAAFRIGQGNPDLEQALLWLLIDAGEGQRLRALLALRERDWQPDSSMHDALAAAYLALSLPDVALRRYLTPHLASHRGDFLWLMNYADALEQNQDPDRAWRLRKQLFLDERMQIRRKAANEALPREMTSLRRTAQARLRMLRSPGDPAYATLRELLRLDRTDAGTLSPAARDAALGWLLDAEQFDAARGWLWQQYASSTTRPLWGEMRLALERNDVAEAGRLLDDYAPLIPRSDRIEAARRVGDVRFAQSEGADAMEQTPADDTLHLQLSEALLAHSHYLRGSTWQSRIGKVDERNDSIRGHAAIAANLALEIDVGRIRRDNRDTTTIGVTPDENYQLGRLVWQHGEARTRFTFASRDSFDHYQTALLEHEREVDSRTTVRMSVGANQPANESTALRVAGMKDLATLGLTYRLTRQDRFSIERQYDQFQAQTGTELGTGHVWLAEYAHALRSEPRSLEASVFWSRHRYGRRNDVRDPRLRPLLPAGTDQATDIAPDFFIPDSFTYRGVRLSTDMNFEEDYTRAWRPYASIARTWHSSEGNGYDLAAGIAGSVFGADHLALGWRMSQGGTRSDGLVREFGLTYRLHF